MNHVSVNYEYHVPLHVKPVQSKKGGVTDAKLERRCNRCKVNDNFGASQIGDLSLRV